MNKIAKIATVFIIDSKREPDTRPRWNINSYILQPDNKNYSHFKSVNLSSNICPKIENRTR